MGELIAEVVPLALAVALSPFPIIPAILLIFTQKPRAAGFSFLSGWVIGVLGSTLLFVLLAALIELADEPPTWASWTRIGLGVVLIAVGLRQAFTRSDSGETPAWMASIDSLEPAGAVRLGLILSAANPKVLLLAAAAGLTVGSEQAGLGQSAVAVLVFTVIASITVALPVLLFTFFGQNILGPLGKVRSWLERHNAIVMAVVILAIGALLIAKGLSGL
ncbi:MAG: GAP family protein [Candidatus Nanopelagicales bacterium]